MMSKLYFKFNEYEITQLHLNILNSGLVSTPPKQRTSVNVNQYLDAVSVPVWLNNFLKADFNSITSFS